MRHRKTVLEIVIVLIGMMLCSSALFASDVGKKIGFLMKDGTEVVGKITGNSDQSITLETNDGNSMMFSRSNIANNVFLSEDSYNQIVKGQKTVASIIEENKKNGNITSGMNVDTDPALDKETQFKIGAGAGIPYGIFGVHSELLIGGHFAPAIGIGSSSESGESASFTIIGANVYLGNRANRFRLRLGFYTGPMYKVVLKGYSYYGGSLGTASETINGTYFCGGFEWRFAKHVSLNLDIGNRTLSKSSSTLTVRSGNSSMTSTTSLVQSVTYPALGIMVQF